MASKVTVNNATDAKPQVLLVMGMAGSGKTTFVKTLFEYLIKNDKKPYIINLDPAVEKLPYVPNIDIRDSIDFKKLMKDSCLGPNGAIMDCMNLYSTQINELISISEKQIGKTNHIIIDSPGQMELFRWSASGLMIGNSFALSFPTSLLYIVDVVRSQDPLGFISNMLFASGIATEFELPFIVAVNKIDIIGWDNINLWMSDCQKFLDDIDESDNSVTGLTISNLAYTLDEFYTGLMRCGISCLNGEGFKELYELLSKARLEYFDVYLQKVLPKRLELKKDVGNLIFEVAPGEAFAMDDDDLNDSTDEDDDNAFALMY